ncbi:HpcH/HpaI aldolase/citrate lyase family protein [Roseococcus suduntuyensis]|uniref:Citrate lyase subunit beta/citryl-CoA lyase n=1 Tax=Roseococcus suduntuyensis TaxID=455361 RepID=A0A840ADB1_9PROT|nr:CoA ester lyase [Roseococcus suduntuyensis]MBB3898526.1 citrate lyase subunit beta/citryl-CoA lyase [Roseococcus suduntuyensis]
MSPGPNRSFLFAPGDHPRRAEKVLEVGADAAILDLEDAVAVAAKPGAREAVRAALARPRRCRGFVRVNAFGTEWCFADLHAVVGPTLDGIVLPKLEDGAELVAVDWMLSALERERGLPPRGIEVMPILETALGFSRLGALAAQAKALGGRVRRLAFGAGDYTLDLGLSWGRAETELETARAAIVLHSRAAGLEPPIDTVWIELRDAEGFAASCARGVALGFQGRLCIHPDQVGVVNAAFSPPPEEVARAERIIAAFAEAEARGLASIQVEGRFVDYPIVERAQRLVALARLIREAPGSA